MGVNLITQSRKFFSQLKNGETYSLNTSDFATHLKGSVMERILARYLVNISWDAQASPSDEWTLSGAVGNNVITRSSGSFLSDGFSVGDVVDIFDDAGTPFPGNPMNVLVVNDTTIIVDGPAMTGGPFTNMLIRGLTELTGYEHRFGIIGNDEPTNFESKLDGTDQIWTAKGVGEDPGGGRITTFIDGETNGQVIGWKTGYVKARYVSNPSTYVQQFEIEHEFIILPFYLAGDQSDISAGIQPPLLAGNATLKYALQMEFRDVLSNPNTSKTVVDDQTLGSVGGFGENFNGFNEKFSIGSVSYEDVATGDPKDSLQVGAATKVTAVVNSADATFTASSIFGVYHSFLPSEPQYADQTEDFETVWVYDNKIQTVGDPAVASTVITEVVGTFGSASQITIEFEVDFTGSQAARIADGDNYILGIQVADNALDSDDTDKVILLGDLGQYDKDTDIEGLVSLVGLSVYPHPQATETGPGATAYTDFKGWNEDGINVSFNLVRDLNEEAEITRVGVNLAAYNPTTEQSFILDQYDIPLGETFFTPDTPNDIQQIDVSTNRGYSLESDDFFNTVQLANAGRLIDDQFYLARVGMKMRWEEWITQPDADQVFYNVSEERFGLNKKSSNYSLKEGYELRVFVDVDMIQDGITTTYRFSSPALDIRDYDLDQYVSPEWTATIRTFAENGTEVTPKVLEGEFTRMVTTWVRTAGAVVDISDFYAIHRIEEDNAQGQVIQELSSITDRRPINGQLLVPLAGETRTKISLASGDVVTECLIDPEQLASGTNYKLSARLGSLTNTPLPVSGQKLTEDGDGKDTEDSDPKILE